MSISPSSSAVLSSPPSSTSECSPSSPEPVVRSGSSKISSVGSLTSAWAGIVSRLILSIFLISSGTSLSLRAFRIFLKSSLLIVSWISATDTPKVSTLSTAVSVLSATTLIAPYALINFSTAPMNPLWNKFKSFALCT